MPVINVSWGDAKQLSAGCRVTQGYRLRRPNGIRRAGRRQYPLFLGRRSSRRQRQLQRCIDGTPTTARWIVQAKPFGLHTCTQRLGWVEILADSYEVPADGSAWLRGASKFPVVRGGSWRLEASSSRPTRQAQHQREFDTLGFVRSKIRH